MEYWQRLFIKSNLSELIDITLCNTALLTELYAKDILSSEEYHEIDVTPNPKRKARMLYEILLTRKNAYDLFLCACKNTKQTGVVSILEEGKLQHKPVESDSNVVLQSPTTAHSIPSFEETRLPKPSFIVPVKPATKSKINYKFSAHEEHNLQEEPNSSIKSSTDLKSSVFTVDKTQSPEAFDKQNSNTKGVLNYFVDFFRFGLSDINRPDSLGRTTLHLALIDGRNLQYIKSLIEYKADYLLKDNNREGVLHFAVYSGNKKVIQYLMSFGLDVNEKNSIGTTPLHQVTCTKPKSYVELTKLLLGYGADLYSKNNNGNTIAHSMAVEEDVSCDDFKIWVTAMIENGHAHLFTIRGQLGRTPLHNSMQRLDLELETIKLIIESAKLDINQPDDQGNTILHLALSYRRSMYTIKSLVELCADCTMKGMDDRSVLHFAVVRSNKEAFLYLKSLGADVNATDKNGETPLHYVASTRSKEYLGMTKVLLKNGAKLNSKDNSGKTLDHWMSSCVWIGAEDYGVWKEGMIRMGYVAFFQQ